MSSTFKLQRFSKAQAPLLVQVINELKGGKKRSHWMWFFFPQLKGLGFSAASDYYGILNQKEAESYLKDPLLGPRLKEMSKMVIEHSDKSINEIFPWPDNLKFRSSMTLFHRADPEERVFTRALELFYEGKEDIMTLKLLNTPL